MEGVELKGGGREWRPQLLELMSNNWVRDRRGGGEVGNKGYAVAVVEKQLELKLGLPGVGDESSPAVTSARESKVGVREREPSLLSLGGVFSCSRPSSSGNVSAGAKRAFLDTLVEGSKQQGYQPQKAGFFGAGASKEEAAAADGGNEEQQHRPGERRAATTFSTANAEDRTQSRTSQLPVVGWPPIRSFRKNIAAGGWSSKPTSSSLPPPSGEKGGSSLVKINMDGVPIGRKVDLSACSGYDMLSVAVNQLFQGLLSAQRPIKKDHGLSGSGDEEESVSITGLLDGCGEYTLVYEDKEGDRMLVGDVPWEMFVSTVKRLRVLKSSELPSLSLGVARRKASHRESLPSPNTAAAGAQG